MANNDQLMSKVDKASWRRLLEGVKRVSEYLYPLADLKDIAKTLQDSPAISVASVVLEGVAQGIPGLKAGVEIIAKLTKIDDPLELCWLACNLAYQQALKDTLSNKDFLVKLDQPQQKLSWESIQSQLHRVREKLENLGVKNEEMETFSQEWPLEHRFVIQADQELMLFLGTLGYSQQQINDIIGKVHDQFMDKFNLILAHGDTREKFVPLETWLRNGGGDEKRALNALQNHAYYQRELFAKKPLFGIEPFALQDVYIKPECGVLLWEQLSHDHSSNQARINEKLDPFSEKYGGRESLLETLLNFLGNEKFKREAIMIQGVAGTGKSSFTLYLCTQLLEAGLWPIRIQIKRLNPSPTLSIIDAITQAIELKDEDDCSTNALTRPENLFLEKFLRRSTVFKGATICRYVLIFDGWDEIKISSNSELKSQISGLLEKIRNEFLSEKYPYPIRVILTGRPSDVVSDSGFLRKNTPILTIRPIRPEQLEHYVGKLKQHLENPSLPIPDEKNRESWEIPDLQSFQEIFDQYKAEYEELESGDPTRSNNLEILGLPLLAYLAIRVMAKYLKLQKQDQSQTSLSDLIDDPATLYRCLTNMTCERAGKAAIKGVPDDTEEMYRFSGNQLRQLLWKTAAAITIMGDEAITHNELFKRLGPREDKGKNINGNIAELTSQNELSKLMVCYYFKGGNSLLGCEFVHKSFREYLFAEAIVAALKTFGADSRRLPQLDEDSVLKDFNEEDPRHRFSRDIAELLAPQWLTPEVVNKLESLIAWEIRRTTLPANSSLSVGAETNKLDLTDWKKIRDGLADLWKWWGNEIHLRPQTSYSERKGLTIHEPYVLDLIDWSAPLDRTSLRNLSFGSSTTIDAHLGDGLFRLCAVLHSEIAKVEGWLENGDLLNPLNFWIDAEVVLSPKPHEYQVTVTREKQTWILFAPLGNFLISFRSYCFRINSAVSRPGGEFPAKCSFNGVFLSGVELAQLNFASADLRGANLIGTNLYGANLNKANLIGANLIGANLIGAKLEGANLEGANLDRASLGRAKLEGANLNKASLEGAKLTDANLNKANLEGANLNKANLNKANLEGANLNNASLYFANLNSANLNSANLEGADLDSANLYFAKLNSASLNGANLYYASLDRAKLNGANLNRASLNGTSLNGTSLNGASLRAADLSTAQDFTPTQLLSAIIDKDTQVPPDLEAVKRQRLQELKD
jgi:uncharacterized protein YjbI with pentapeptide repeats